MRESAQQMFFHYRDWEDWQAGLYDTHKRPERIELARAVLRSPETFTAVLEDLEAAWPIAVRQNLSNVYRNHQPWCGRAAACFEHGSTMYETNAAWAEMTCLEREAANRVADRWVFKWRSTFMPGQGFLPFGGDNGI